ncbi:1-aminocyclopropane-1-carboxylate deaminase/D-cysteine desulfhydrase [Daejeonella sp.]|uniref:1-aminocyclopropane-1-carboxylate deaminase/D-cysteine desulfhydrase n=1 Tax=Daejeonella sp. TaxID=2805397 RepID=UPI003982FD58
MDLQLHSPIEQIFDPLFTEKKVEIFVKRDDMIHPFISGNKWRKLKYILSNAESLNKKHLITFGGAFSNHLLATACAAARFGFKSTGFVRGEKVQNDILMLCQLFGMKLLFTDRLSYREKHSLYTAHFQDDTDAIFIDEGGAGELGVMGCAELVHELPENYDHIFCAAGTGTTAAGIIRSIDGQTVTSHVHIIPVLKGGSFIGTEIKKYTNNKFILHPGYHCGGYAKTTPELLTFIQNFCKLTGILIEPVYTGKMFFALYDLIQKDQFLAGSKILAIHTGGLLGILGMSSKFNLNS